MSTSADAVLKKHGKTFNFAKLFLGEEVGNDAARLYAFCRHVDDIADEPMQGVDPQKALNELKHALQHNMPNGSITEDFLQLCKQKNFSPHLGIQLIEGAQQDLNEVALEDESALLRYAYHVAGVVGLMMASILGADRKGYPFAVDLGIAMQLTNIARDVLEDAQNQRRYIPGEWAADLSPENIVNAQPQHKKLIQNAIRRLLELAESYYESGFAGIAYLPKLNQRGIYVAGTLYREIGQKLLRHDCQYWQGRTVVGFWHKCSLAVSVLSKRQFEHALSSVQPSHKTKLHASIASCLPNL
jgi:phytoene synthase